jgi:uroporphyrinogen-III synthase
MGPVLLILRPQPGADATAARAAAVGLKGAIAPLFHLRPTEWESPEASEVDAVLLTSANAARLGGKKISQLANLPCYAVGEATADAARSAGFTEVRTGTSDGAAALQMMVRHGAKRVLHLCGREHITLADPEARVVRRVVYAAEQVSTLPALAVEALRACALVLIHSPRAGSVFATLVDQCGLGRGGTRLVAISDAAAAEAGSGWKSVDIAPRPRDEALLELVAKLCKIERCDTGKVG